MTDNEPTALITGGAGGIGAATARLLLDQGYRVAATGRDPERLAGFAKGLGDPARLLTVVGDATDPDSVRAAVDATVERFGRLDVAIANAGLSTHDRVTDGDPAGWREMVLVNVLGPALLIRAALPALRRTRGRIVLLGSVAGLIYAPGNLYSATKWAVTGLAENTRRAVTADGVGVTLIAPGRVETEGFWERTGGPPAGDLLPVAAVAAAIVWAVRQPDAVDVNTVTVRPKGQPT